MTDVAPLVGEPTFAEDERKTCYLEVFFDLVVVFAFTQVKGAHPRDLQSGSFRRGPEALQDEIAIG